MSNISDALEIGHVSDVAKLKREIFLLSDYSCRDVERLYSHYSAMYCAGWLVVDEDSIRDFASWLEH